MPKVQSHPPVDMVHSNHRNPNLPKIPGIALNPKQPMPTSFTMPSINPKLI